MLLSSRETLFSIYWSSPFLFLFSSPAPAPSLSTYRYKMSNFIYLFRLIAKILFSWSIPGLLIVFLLYSGSSQTNREYLILDASLFAGAILLHPLITSYLKKRHNLLISPSMSSTNIMVGLLACLFFIIQVIDMINFSG